MMMSSALTQPLLRYAAQATAVWNGVQDKLAPVASAVDAACPYLIPAATIWALHRAHSCLHEAGHTLAAKALGYHPRPHVTWHLKAWTDLADEAETERMSRHPWHDFLFSIGGPAADFAATVGLAFYLFHDLAPWDVIGFIQTVVTYPRTTTFALMCALGGTLNLTPLSEGDTVYAFKALRRALGAPETPKTLGDKTGV